MNVRKNKARRVLITVCAVGLIAVIGLTLMSAVAQKNTSWFFDLDLKTWDLDRRAVISNGPFRGEVPVNLWCRRETIIYNIGPLLITRVKTDLHESTETEQIVVPERHPTVPPLR